MKTHFKRISILALMLILAFALTACADDAGNGAAPSGYDGFPTPYGETVTVTWAVQASAVQRFFDGDNYDYNRWSRRILEDLNIQLEVAFSADIMTDAFLNRMQVALASGDLPDIFEIGEPTWFHQAQEAGFLYDLTDMLESYAADGIKAYRAQFPGGFDGATIDGRLYAFPSIVDNFHQAVYLWIREDWLAEAGGQPPETVDEMIELARQFTSGDGSTFGLGLSQNLTLTDFGNIAGLASSFGVPVRGQDVFYRGEDGLITHGWIQPGVRDALEVLRDMFAEGLIDPEFVVKDQAALIPDIATGRIGMMFHMNWGTWWPFNMLFEEEGIVTRPFPVPVAEGREVRIGVQNNETPERLFMLNANATHPEAFMKILNLYYYIVYESGNLDYFERYWAEEQYRLVPVYLHIANELFAPELLPALAANDASDLSAAVLPFFNFVQEFETGINTDPTRYGTWGQMFERGSMAIALEYKDRGQMVYSIMGAERPEIWLQMVALFETEMNAVFTDIITGARPLEAFDQFVQDWLNMGGQQVLDELNEMFPN
ncbi:MAG: extracellular solute-binding protein [Oscillospiraceae bacterium]|nr:extracellular solute-binding protein [Oscillospiraceae bacterium]